MRALIALIVLSISIAVVSCDRGSNIEKGEYYLEKGEFKSAVIEFKKAIQKEPNSAPARLALARAYYQNGDTTYAIQELNRALEFDSGLIEARGLLAKSNLAFGDLEASLKESEIYLKQNPKEPEILIAKARALAGLGSVTEAKEIIDGVIKENSNFAPAYVALGQVNYIQNDKPAAERAFLKAVEIDPNSADSQIALGDFYKAAEQTDKAIAAYEKAVELQPKNLVAMINLGGVYNVSKKTDKAIEIATLILKRFKGLPQGHYILGSAYYIQGDIDRALPELEKAGQIAPANYLLALAFAKKEQNPIAIEKAKKAISLNPKFIEAYVLLGRIYLQQGFNEDAVSVLEKALAQNPNPDSELLNLLGVAYAKSKNLDKALQSFRESIGADPRQAESYAYLASLYSSVGNPDESLKVYKDFATQFESQEGADIPLILNYIKIGRIEQAIELCLKNLAKNPKDYLYMNLLGVAYLKKDDLPKAKETFTKAVEIDPQKTDAYLNLAHIAKIEGKNEEIVALCEKVLERDPKNLVAIRALIEAEIALGGRKQAIAKLEVMLSKAPKDLLLNTAAGEVYLADNNLQKAEEYAKRAIQIDAASGGGHAILGLSYLSQGGKLDQAEAELRKAVELAPNNYLFHFRFGQTLAAAGKFAEARTEFDKTSQLNPPFIPAKLALAQVLISSEKYVEAIERLNKIKSEAPNTPGVDYSLGVAYQGAKDNKNAVPSYREHLKNYPKDPAALNNLAWILAEGKQYEEAVALARKALEIVPNNSNVIDTYGWILHLSGKRQESLAQLEKAVSLAPNQPTIRYHLGVVHFALGNKAAAKKEIERSLEISANFPEAAEARKLLTQIR